MRHTQSEIKNRLLPAVDEGQAYHFYAQVVVLGRQAQPIFAKVSYPSDSNEDLQERLRRS